MQAVQLTFHPSRAGAPGNLDRGVTMGDELIEVPLLESENRKVGQHPASATIRDANPKSGLQSLLSKVGTLQGDIARATLLGKARAVEAKPPIGVNPAGQVVDVVGMIEGSLTRGKVPEPA